MTGSRRMWAGAALAAVAAASLGAILASAVPSAPAQSALMSYDCDTPSGRFSELSQVQPGPSYRIAGRVAAHELRPDKRWPSVAAIRIESADEQHRIMIEVTAAAGTDGPLALSLRTIHGLENEVRQLGEAPAGDSLGFSLVVADGKARIEIGGRRAEAPADVGPWATVGVGCSTGSFRFEQLTLHAP